MIEIKMPRLSDTMEEGAIATWHKHPGDAVAVGDVLVEIETDKAVMEYEAYQAGTLAEILVPEGRNADIGTPIALLDDGSGGLAPSAPATGTHHPAPEREQQSPAPPASPSIPAQSGPTAPPAARTPAQGATASSAVNGRAGDGGANGTIRQVASPLVRKLARENHLDLSHVTGTGPGGRIIRADITGLLAGGAPAPRNPRRARARNPRDRAGIVRCRARRPRRLRLRRRAGRRTSPGRGRGAAARSGAAGDDAG